MCNGDFIFITCNGNLINYKAKNACNAQVLFHNILITCIFFATSVSWHFCNNYFQINKLMDILRIHWNLIVYLKFSFIKTSRVYTFP